MKQISDRQAKLALVLKQAVLDIARSPLVETDYEPVGSDELLRSAHTMGQIEARQAWLNTDFEALAVSLDYLMDLK